MRDEGGQTLGTLNTLFLGTGVCEKRFLHALDVMSLYNPSPLSSMLVVRQWGGLPPAKKDSLSARAQLHRHLFNIEERGKG